MNYELIEYKNDYTEIEQFLENFKYQNYMQSVVWGAFKEASGKHWKYRVVGLKENGTLIGSAVIHIRDLPSLSKKMWYIPRGLVVDYDNVAHVENFSKHLAEYAKHNKCAFIKIDPYIEIRNRNLEGEIITDESAFHNTKLIDVLKKCGFNHLGYIDDTTDLIQPRNTLILDLKRDEEEIYKGFNKKAISGIKAATKHCVEVYEGSIDDIPLCYELMNETAIRSQFLIRDINYFRKMYEMLFPKKMLKLYFAKINTKKLLATKEDELNKLLEKQNRMLSNTKQKVNEKTIFEIQTNIEKLSKDVVKHHEMYNENPDGIVIATAIVTYFGKTANYLFAGSTDEYRIAQAPYLMQWEIIKDAKNMGCTHYDFIGVLTTDANSPKYGVYLFKYRFASKFVELAGEFDLVVSKSQYFAYNTMLSINKNIRKPLLLLLKGKK